MLIIDQLSKKTCALKLFLLEIIVEKKKSIGVGERKERKGKGNRGA
jgi:hypothetical protein